MPEIQTTTTVVGDVEYETETCCNCGNDVLADEAVKLAVDPIKASCGGASICSAKVPVPKTTRHMCEYCADTVLDYTRRRGDFVLYPFGGDEPLVAVLASLVTLMVVLFFNVVVMAV